MLRNGCKKQTPWCSHAANDWMCFANLICHLNVSQPPPSLPFVLFLIFKGCPLPVQRAKYMCNDNDWSGARAHRIAHCESRCCYSPIAPRYHNNICNQWQLPWDPEIIPILSSLVLLGRRAASFSRIVKTDMVCASWAQFKRGAHSEQSQIHHSSSFVVIAHALQSSRNQRPPSTRAH